MDAAVEHLEGLPMPVGFKRPRRSRSGRGLSTRAVTISGKKLTKAERAAGIELEIDESLRPKKRTDCVDGCRPCPWVSCKWHLYLDVNPETGSIKLNFPDKEPEELYHSCLLDIVEQNADGLTLETVGAYLNLTRERIRQVEVKAATRAQQEIRAREKNPEAYSAPMVQTRPRQKPRVGCWGEGPELKQEDEMARPSSFELLGVEGQQVISMAMRGTITKPEGYRRLEKLAKQKKVQLSTQKAFETYIRRRNDAIANKSAEDKKKREFDARKATRSKKAKSKKPAPPVKPAKTRKRQAVAPGTEEPTNGERVAASRAIATTAVLRIIDGEAPKRGFFVFPDGRIWTPDVNDAIALSNRCREMMDPNWTIGVSAESRVGNES